MPHRTENLNVVAFDVMPSPDEIHRLIPLTETAADAVVAGRRAVTPPKGIAPSAAIDPSAVVESSVVGPNASVGEGARVTRSIVQAGACIGARARAGVGLLSRCTPRSSCGRLSER